MHCQFAYGQALLDIYFLVVDHMNITKELCTKKHLVPLFLN